MAVKEGITSRDSSVGGYGLNHIQRFVGVNTGKMTIMSGSAKWTFPSSRTKPVNRLYDGYFNGTIINLTIDVDKEGYYFLDSETESIF
ncbi:MAG: hypothetical protein HQK56_04485 [Deltaproteobacteria bacterium]|nr:hypothetical protein [Deltaproteobacteria bacterium]